MGLTPARAAVVAQPAQMPRAVGRRWRQHVRIRAVQWGHHALALLSKLAECRKQHRGSAFAQQCSRSIWPPANAQYQITISAALPAWPQSRWGWRCRPACAAPPPPDQEKKRVQAQGASDCSRTEAALIQMSTGLRSLTGYKRTLHLHPGPQLQAHPERQVDFADHLSWGVHQAQLSLHDKGHPNSSCMGKDFAANLGRQ